MKILGILGLVFWGISATAATPTTCEADISLLNKTGAAIKAKNNVAVTPDTQTTDTTKACLLGTEAAATQLCKTLKGTTAKLPGGQTLDNTIVSYRANVRVQNTTVRIPKTPCKN